MDENTVRLLDSVFRAYEPDAGAELLDDVKIFSAEVDMKTRSALVTICPDRYVTLKQVRSIRERGISRPMASISLTLRTCYGKDNLSLLKPEDVGAYLKGVVRALYVHSGCQYRLEGETVVLQLRGNGKDMLRPHVARAERWLKDMFETPVVDIQAGKG